MEYGLLKKVLSCNHYIVNSARIIDFQKRNYSMSFAKDIIFEEVSQENINCIGVNAM